MNHGALSIRVEDAKQGDLIFSQGGPNPNNYTGGQRGFGHVGWVYGPNVSYSGLNPTDGLALLRIDWFHDINGSPFNLALDMSSIY